MELNDLKGIGEKTLGVLNKIGISSINDLVNFMPKSYWDMTKVANIDDSIVGNYVLLEGIAQKPSGCINVRRGLNLFSCHFRTGTRVFKGVWFNAPFLRKNLTEGQEYLIWGKINKFTGKCPELINPSFELKGDSNRLMGVVPIYRTQGLLKQQTLRNLIEKALNHATYTSIYDVSEEAKKIININCEDSEKDLLFNDKTMSLKEAYYKSHFPTSVKEGYVGKYRIMHEELISSLIAYKVNKEGEFLEETNEYNLDIEVIQGLIDSLPFALSESQKKALNDIIISLKSKKRTNRMLQGDVGSGKTVVAFLAMLFAVKCGYQCAIMAPTEILAKQHFNTFHKFFSKQIIETDLLCGSTKKSERKEILIRTKTGNTKILFGTHSVINEEVKFKKLGFIVIDELHRFGVKQKSKLEDKTKSTDVLIMSATPIPRTLALTAFGDLEISYLSSRKEKEVQTFLIGDDKLDGMYEYIAKKVQEGEQAYVVCPRVEDSEGIEMFSAKVLYKKLKEGAFKNIAVGLVYGGMKEESKNKVMEQFFRNEIGVLIATTVIEVGIDSQRASIMAVLNSDNFGLATLHQLRGRVGRKETLDAYCFLHTTKQDNERLIALKQFSNGSDIAEIDGQIRGYGDFLGVKQSGGGDINQLKVTKDSLLKCKAIAEMLLKYDRERVLSLNKVIGLLDKTKDISLS